jgi:hypothetical protein
MRGRRSGDAPLPMRGGMRRKRNSHAGALRGYCPITQSPGSRRDPAVYSVRCARWGFYIPLLVRSQCSSGSQCHRFKPRNPQQIQIIEPFQNVGPFIHQHSVEFDLADARTTNNLRGMRAVELQLNCEYQTAAPLLLLFTNSLTLCIASCRSSESTMLYLLNTDRVR